MTKPKRPDPRAFDSIPEYQLALDRHADEIDAWLSSGDEVTWYYPVSAAAMLPCDTPLILADDHDRLRAQDREFTERLVKAAQWAREEIDEGFCVDNLRDSLNALITEWKARNETA